MNHEEKFRQYLKEGEQVLWTGKPKAGLLLRDADIIVLPVSIILIGFAVVLDYVMLQMESPLVFKALGVFLAMAGIYFGGLRFFLDRQKRRNIFYAITNKRVLVISGSKQKLKTLPLQNIDRLDKTEEKDGSGFIIFGTANPLWPWLLGKFVSAGNHVPGLEMLPDVNSVYQLLEDRIKIELPEILKEQLNEDQPGSLN